MNVANFEILNAVVGIHNSSPMPPGRYTFLPEPSACNSAAHPPKLGVEAFRSIRQEAHAHATCNNVCEQAPAPCCQMDRIKREFSYVDTEICPSFPLRHRCHYAHLRLGDL